MAQTHNTLPTPSLANKPPSADLYLEATPKTLVESNLPEIFELLHHYNDNPLDGAEPLKQPGDIPIAYIHCSNGKVIGIRIKQYFEGRLNDGYSKPHYGFRGEESIRLLDIWFIPDENGNPKIESSYVHARDFPQLLEELDSKPPPAESVALFAAVNNAWRNQALKATPLVQ